MAGRVRFIPNPKFDVEMRATPGVRAHIRAKAEEVARRANDTAKRHGAPWMPSRPGDPIVVVVRSGRYYVLNTDYGGALMEWGSKNNPPFAPLRLACRAAGLRLKDQQGR